jgi:pimeloyl-ACP methyl ester carboxylesterase
MSKLTTEYLDLPDIRIAYCQHGAGRPLILLHGNSGSKSTFTDFQLVHFSEFHTFALDSRGHGQSRSQDDAYSIEQFSEDVIRFCQAKAIPAADVIGYSDGGNIALWLACKAPELFPHLIAISPNTLVSGTTDGTLRTIRQTRKIMAFLNRIGFNLKKPIMRFDLMLHDIGLSDDDLRGIRTRVKILYAEKDMIKEEHIQQIAGLIPQASLSKIADCTHLTIVKSEEALRVMEAFLLGEA